MPETDEERRERRRKYYRQVPTPEEIYEDARALVLQAYVAGKLTNEQRKRCNEILVSRNPA